MTVRWIGLAAGVVVAAAGLAQGATIADLELGELWMGEAWDQASLKDRVVLVEFWGYN
jgi:hypothetical protein